MITSFYSNTPSGMWFQVFLPLDQISTLQGSGCDLKFGSIANGQGRILGGFWSKKGDFIIAGAQAP